MKKSRNKVGMVFLALMLSISCQADEFTLFNEGRGVIEEKGSAIVIKAPKKNRVVRKQKKIKLIGTSRIGSRYTVFVEDDSRKIHKIYWREGGNVKIPNNPGYSLTQALPRSVQISFPDNNRCLQDHPEYGIKCLNKGEHAELSLLRKRAIPGPQPKKARQGSRPKTGFSVNSAAPENPFKEVSKQKNKKTQDKILSREAKQKSIRGRRTISEDQVPAGKRVVKTPFGDVLVDLK